MNTLITLFLSIIIVFFAKKFFERTDFKTVDMTMKTFAVLFCIIGVFRYFLSDSFVENVEGFSDPIQSFLHWGYHIGYAIIPMSIFFDSRLFRNIASYFCLPISVLCAFFYNSTFAYFMAEGSEGMYLNPHFRHFYYTLELIIAISLPILMQIQSKHVINTEDKKEILQTIGIIPLIMIQMMPSYIPHSLISSINLNTGMFGAFHLLWLICLTAEILILYYVFRKRTYKEKYMLVTFLVIAQVMHTTSPFLRGFEYSRIPLQLCNIAAFFYLFLIITKKQRVFEFCFLANLVGAAIAMILVDFSSNPVTFWNIHYVYEHSFVVMVPVLCKALRIFPRLSKSAIKNMALIFTVYFAFVFILGTIINSLDNTLGTFAVNHFFMFNPNTAVEYLPFAGFTSWIHWQIGPFEIYPLLVLSTFSIFLLINIAFYFIVKLSYKLIDRRKENRTLSIQ